jgi:tetratricopeptide (TPR) repeat protein
MSTKRDTQYAAKRRAAARKRNRELVRQIGTYIILAVLIIGTVSTVFIAQTTTSSQPLSSVTPTATLSSTLQQLVTQADQALATGVYTEAIGLYNAYLSQIPSDADVNFKLGKAYLDSNNPSPDYIAGLDHLQRALQINPSGSWAAEANALVEQYNAAGIATVGALQTATASAPTAVLTGTGTPALGDTNLDSSPVVPATP